MSGSNAWAAELILVANPWTASQFYPAGTCVLSAIDIPSWTTATRPSSPNLGRTGFNTTLGVLEQWTGSAWQPYLAGNLASPPPIGNTTPNTGAFTTLSATSTNGGAGTFTTLSASSTISGAGFTAWAASPPAIGGTAPAAGAFTTLSASGALTPSQTNGIVGTTTNNNANAGSMGEFVTSTASSFGFSTATPTNITTISLTAGDWDVWGSISMSFSGGNAQSPAGWINTVSATQPAGMGGGASWLQTQGSVFITSLVQPIGMLRLLLASTTTVYLSGQATFAGTGTIGGIINARRRR